MFYLALVSTCRPGMKRSLHLDQVKKVDANREPAFLITVRIAAPGAVKKPQGGMQAAGDKPKELNIWLPR